MIVEPNTNEPLPHQDQHGEKSEAAKPDVTSTPSKKLGLFWDRSSEAAKLEEELMTTKLHETAAVAELKEARLKVGGCLG